MYRKQGMTTAVAVTLTLILTVEPVFAAGGTPKSVTSP